MGWLAPSPSSSRLRSSPLSSSASFRIQQLAVVEGDASRSTPCFLLRSREERKEQPGSPAVLRLPRSALRPPLSLRRAHGRLAGLQVELLAGAIGIVLGNEAC